MPVIRVSNEAYQQILKLQAEDGNAMSVFIDRFLARVTEPKAKRERKPKPKPEPKPAPAPAPEPKPEPKFKVGDLSPGSTGDRWDGKEWISSRAWARRAGKRLRA